jgi:hypothetical protein
MNDLNFIPTAEDLFRRGLEKLISDSIEYKKNKDNSVIFYRLDKIIKYSNKALKYFQPPDEDKNMKIYMLGSSFNDVAQYIYDRIIFKNLSSGDFCNCLMRLKNSLEFFVKNKKSSL